MPEPSPTPSGLGFHLGGIPVAVQPWFFLTAWIVGRQSMNVGRELVWIGVVFTGVLLHELGHALAARYFGLAPRITLHGFGGTTAWAPSRAVGAWSQIAITAAGPLVGILVGSAAWWAMRVQLVDAPILLSDVLWVNLGWGVLNLLPILPLDGGQIAGTLGGLVAGWNGRIVVRVLSLLLLAGIGVWGVLLGLWWTLLLVMIFGVSNLQALQTEWRVARGAP
jgi:membrane-associated protease RseP (regulator of RpoE activity)